MLEVGDASTGPGRTAIAEVEETRLEAKADREKVAQRVRAFLG